LFEDGQAVLDLGCGNGRLLTGLKADLDYMGIDFSSNLISSAKKFHPGKKFIRGDITQVETWNQLPKFDAIFCVAVLHHLPQRDQHLFVFKQAGKHLKKNGFLFLSVWNLWQLNRLGHHFKNGSLKLKLTNWRFINTLFQHKWQMFCFAFDKKYLGKLTLEAGFKEYDIFYADKKGVKTGMLKGRNLCAFIKSA
jgi:2-polyprenyl-3-methyl-5-hydroxy-6-metoxy-1,4-benzoquinol methylase